MIDLISVNLRKSNLSLLDEYLKHNSMVNKRVDRIVISKVRKRYDSDISRSTARFSQWNEEPKKKGMVV